MTEYTIRDATEQDVLDTVLAAYGFYKEAAPTSWGKFDSKKVNNLFMNLVNHELGFVKIVVYEEEIVGALIGVVQSMPINNLTFSQELMFWIDPEHRNGKTSFKLIDQYVEWSKEKNCEFARLSTIDETTGAKAGVLFKRKGFKPTETAYIKEI